MGFIAPGFLAGLAAVGLPIYFHLLKRHKTTPLPFASLMFFERRTQSSIKHRRLQYLLLFALRLAFIILLVQAKTDALNVIQGMGAADRAQVLAFGGPTRILTDMINDKEALKAAVTD